MTLFDNPQSLHSTYDTATVQPYLHRNIDKTDPTRLAPHDAYAYSPPRRGRQQSPLVGAVNAGRAGGGISLPEPRRKKRGRSTSRRKKTSWKKLLWVKQSFPDNYTDEETFLDHLQRNPRLQPYEFWPLVADSTVIVQHVCSVLVFACCFTGIFLERVSPVTVVSWGSFGTILGWILWDFWIGQEEAAIVADGAVAAQEHGAESSQASSIHSSAESLMHGKGTASNASGLPQSQRLPRRGSGTAASSIPSATTGLLPDAMTNAVSLDHSLPVDDMRPIAPRRAPQRLETVKSAFLIYCALLGLSPILKSLTKSTSSDSIWALSTWLMCINVFFFDYGGGVGAK